MTNKKKALRILKRLGGGGRKPTAKAARAAYAELLAGKAETNDVPAPRGGEVLYAFACLNACSPVPPSVAELSGFTSTSESTVSAHVRSLHKHGFLERIREAPFIARNFQLTPKSRAWLSTLNPDSE